MINHIWSIIAQKSIIESDSNTLSIIDILEELEVIPANNPNLDVKSPLMEIPIPYEVVSFLTRSESKKEIKPFMSIELINPDGKILKSVSPQVVWQADKDRLRVRVKIRGIVVDKPGTYIFKIGLKEKAEENFKNVAEVPLQVHFSNKLPH